MRAMAGPLAHELHVPGLALPLPVAHREEMVGHGTGVPADQRKRAWCRRPCPLPAGDVGATRWVARRVRRTRDRGVALCGTIAHDGGRAIYRDGIAAARRGGDDRDDGDPPRSHDDSIDPHPAVRAGLSLAGRAVSLLLRWEQAAVSVRFLNGANPSGRQCRGDPVGRPWGAVYTGERVR